MMRNTHTFTMFLVASLVLSMTTAAAEEKVYRWVDEDGVVHFSSQPSDQADTREVKLPKAPKKPSPASPEPTATEDGEPAKSYAQQLRDERAEAKREAAEKKKEMDALCERHLRIVTQLEPMTRVLYEQPDGTVTRMADDDRIERLNESKDFMARNCNK